MQHASGPNILQTAIFWTPPQTWVQIHVNLELEPDVFLEKICGAKPLNICFQEFNVTAMLHTWDPYDLSIDYVCLQMACETFFAKLVVTREPEEF